MTQTSTLSDTNVTRSLQSAGSGWTKILWPLWIILLVAGLVGIWQRFTYGHDAGGYGSYVPWGLWIALYFMGVAISGGAFVFGALGYILRWPGFSEKADLRIAVVLSLAAILPAFLLIWLDLGHMERLYMVFTSATFTSMIAFNAWMYNVFLVVAIVSWLLSFKEYSIWLKPLLCLGTLLSILFPSQSGVFFEAIGTKEYWNSSLLSMMFLSSAIAAGAGTLLLVKLLLSPAHNQASTYDRGVRTLRFITVAALVVYLAFEFAEISIALWRPHVHSLPVERLVFGQYWWSFWLLQLLIGAVIPLLLYVLTDNKWAWGIATLSLILGFVAGRMGILIPGQVVGQIPGLQEAFQDVRLTYSYHTTAMEYLVGVFMVALGMAIFYIGLRLTSVWGSKSGQKV